MHRLLLNKSCFGFALTFFRRTKAVTASHSDACYPQTSRYSDLYYRQAASCTAVSWINRYCDK